MNRFDDIPGEIRRRVADGERVILIVLDALGMVFFERHADHPLIQRLKVTPIRSQFPSTTTAHMTTLHFGLRVEDHGLYEWTVFDPLRQQMICPLRSSRADQLAPGPTFYETLGARSVVAHPEWIAGSSYSLAATRGATMQPFPDLAAGLSALVGAFAADETLRYGLIYWDRIDAFGHMHGPDSEVFDTEIRQSLDAVESATRNIADGVTVLITADHGQVAVAPDRVDHLDELWPELPALLSIEEPAGSSRDVFLHPLDGCAETVIDGLTERLGDRATIHRATDLFGAIGPRLAERVGEVVVLPAAGRQAWFRRTPANEQWFRGQHGGLDPAETSTYLAELTSY